MEKPDTRPWRQYYSFKELGVSSMSQEKRLLNIPAEDDNNPGKEEVSTKEQLAVKQLTESLMIFSAWYRRSAM